MMAERAGYEMFNFLDATDMLYFELTISTKYSRFLISIEATPFAKFAIECH